MNKIISIVAVVIIVFGGGYYLVSNKNIEDSSSVMEDNNSIMVKESTNTAMEDGSIVEEGKSMMKVGSYEVYSPDKFARSETGSIVLFFRAVWCPTCRALDSDIRSHLENIPAGVLILDVDYDNSTTLKQKYGITYQHTLVQVDKDGNMIKKWSGSPTLATMISELK